MLFLNLPGIGRVAQEVTPTTTTDSGTAVSAALTPDVAPTAVAATTQASSDFFASLGDTGVFGTLSAVFLVLGIIALAVGLWLYLVGKNRWLNVSRFNFRLANTWSLIAIAAGALAVLFALFRLLQVPGLDLRFWLYLVGLLWAAFIGYGIYYFTTRYRADLAAANAKQRGGRGASPSRARSGGSTATNAATTAPARPKGAAGNPRGTSERGERRREKR